ncbi:uncharacterized protein LOC111241046 [Vigna radiata var. radiata]|uniref:Uncharacterized protein LOC111241046 n=1 Tax=Vigna radiata var. radiata TaxID=3916 RepID=A0A3Q0ESG2_VIGRR|nr:uncharacterized protein LOC111241046 [Vigna radiata var. radiata]
MKPPDVPDEDMFLRAFPHSLQEAAWGWLYCLPPRSVTSWEDLTHQFLDKFSPVRYGYIDDPGRNDPNLGWYGTLQHQYHEPSLQTPCMPPPIQEPQQLQFHEPTHSLSAVGRKWGSKLDSLESLVTQLTSNQRPTPSSASVARLCAICPSSNHSTDACPSLDHPVTHDEPQAYATNMYKNRQPQHKNQRKQQQQKAPAKSSTSTSSEPTLNDLWRQMVVQCTEEQSQFLEGSPLQTVPILDDVSVIHVGDGEQSHKLTTAPSTSPHSYASPLALEDAVAHSAITGDMIHESTQLKWRPVTQSGRFECLSIHMSLLK